MKILLTGGGSGGHVTPNIALLPFLRERGWRIVYTGSREGMEKGIAESHGITYFGISTGKMRRYISIDNFFDIFRVIKGIFEAFRIIGREKPDALFSKGGFVAAPVVFAGWLRRVPVIIHESDFSPGLATRLSIPFAKAICASFPETMSYLPKNKARLTGPPVRREIFLGEKEQGKAICGFHDSKPVLLVMGGSGGSKIINDCLDKCLSKLLNDFNVVHIRGKGNEASPAEGYKPFGYLGEELPHVLALCEIVITRAGANAIFELLALKKPALLVPLSLKASRGDQICNAQSFAAQGFSMVLPEENLDPDNLYESACRLYENREKLTAAMKKAPFKEGAAEIIRIIENIAGG